MKRKIFAQLDKICKPEKIFATNTSVIMVTSIANAVERKEKFIGMHWFNPALVMKLTEIVRGALTSDETRLYELGIAGIKEIDDMCKLAFGFSMGPFELMDLIGLDTVYHIAEYLYNETKEIHYAPPNTLKKLVFSGYIGDKKLKFGSKGGWYDFYGIKK